MNHEGESMNIFQPAIPDTIQVKLGQVEKGLANPSTPKEDQKPTFGPRPDCTFVEFNFEGEIQ